MLLLVTDTSGKHGSVALARADDSAAQSAIEVVEEVALAGGTFSAQLVPQISTLLGKHGFTKHDIGAFIVVSGPGSFTGLRVGLAAIKALAEILHKPIVPVSLLEVVARNGITVPSGKDGRTTATCDYAAALDAGRQEAFVGQYEIVFRSKEDLTFKSLSESLLGLEELADLLESGAAQWIATPDAAIVEFLSGPAAVPRVANLQKRPGALEVARLGWLKLQSNEVVTADQLEANYIRRSDAEIFSKPTC